MLTASASIALALLGFSLATHAATISRAEPKSASLEITTVAPLFADDTRTSMVFHANFLYVGISSQGDNTFANQVKVFSAADVLLATVTLSHSAEYFYPYSADTILVLGRKCCPWSTHATELGFRNGQLYKKTTNFPEYYQVLQFAGTPSRFFVSEPGSRAVFQWQRQRMVQVPAQFSSPWDMEYDGQRLWVLELGAYDWGDENLSYYDFTTQSGRRVSSQPIPGLSQIQLLAGRALIAGSTFIEDEVFFLRTADQTLAGAVPVSGAPTGMTQLGRCLIVTSENSQEVTFIDVDTPAPEKLATWDISAAGEALLAPSKVAVNPQTGTLYLRSTAFCPTCISSRNSVVAVREPGRGVVNHCLGR